MFYLKKISAFIEYTLLIGGVILTSANCTRVNSASRQSPVKSPVTYYVDARQGDDQHTGTSQSSPWKSLGMVENAALLPGDTVRFKRGSEFTGPLIIRQSGSADRHIVLSDYGENSDPAPGFTNPVFEQGNFGNCIRVKGSYVIVENLYFHHTAAFKAGNYETDGGWPVWESGAIYIDKGAENCIVRNNEIFDCVAGIKSYGHNAIIEYNFIHDCNRVLGEWNWGPIGIWLGADFQEVRFNRIFNYSAVDPRIRWKSGIGGGADGGAMEIDDARYDKSHISIHHNYTRDCQGFLEVTWRDVKAHPDYRNFKIHHNISDDYQQFLALWAGKDCEIDNNTIVRRKVNVNDWGVFNIVEANAKNKIRNNIIVTEKNIPVFNTGLNGDHYPANIIRNNLFFAAADTVNMGKEGPGESPVFGNPAFRNYSSAAEAGDFSILPSSRAIDRGLSLGYPFDFEKAAIPSGNGVDIGAYEHR